MPGMEKFFQYMSNAENGLGAEDPIAANKRIKEEDYADPETYKPPANIAKPDETKYVHAKGAKDDLEWN
jgi:hypothetical protein